MPIMVSCACGKQLRVPDEHAGKRVKCPGCQQIVNVPGGGAAAFAPEPAGSNMVRFSCPQCNRQMQAKAEFAGRATRCPGCQATVPIPGGSGAPAGGAGSPFGFGGPEPEEAGMSRPRRRRGQGGNMVMLIAAGAGSALLITVLLLGYFFLFSGSSADLALIPGDAPGFFTVRVADIWNNPEIKKMIDENLKGPQLDELKKKESETGLKVTDIERVTMVAKDAKGSNFWAIVKLYKGPSDRAKFAQSMMETEPTKKDHKGVTYFTSGNGSKAIGFHSDTILFGGTEDQVKEAIETSQGAKKSGSLSSALSLASGSSYQIVAAGTVPPEMKGQLSPMMQALQPPMDKLKVFADLKAGIVALSLSGKMVSVEVRGTMPDSATATSGKTALDEVKKIGEGLLPVAKMQMNNNPQGAKVFDQLEKAFKELTITSSGSDVIVKTRMEMDVDALKGAANLPMMR